MKKVYKVFLIIAAALMILGFGIVGVTFAAAGFQWEKFTLTEEDLVEHRLDIEGKDVTTLSLADMSTEVGWYDVRIVPSEDNDIHIQYRGLEKDDLGYETMGNKVSLFASVNRKWYENIHIGFSFLDALPLTIAIPSSVENVDILDGVSGNVDCSDLSLKGNLSYYGDASRMVMNRMDIGGTLHLESDLSSITLCDVKAQSISADVDCGDLCFESVQAKDMDIQTDLGNFEFSSLFVGNSLRITTDCGNVEGTIDDEEEQFTVVSNVDLGETNLSSGGKGPKSLEVRADTGDIHVTFMK